MTTMVNHIKNMGKNECEIVFAKNIEDYNYKRWTCAHGQVYYFDIECEKWKVTHFIKYGNQLGCGCKVPCSPNENRGLITLERHLDLISDIVGECPYCANKKSTVLGSYPRCVVIQCDSCGSPRTIKPDEIWEEIRDLQEKREEREREIHQLVMDRKYIKSNIKHYQETISFYKKNGKNLIQEAINKEKAKISREMKDAIKEIKENKDRLKKLNVVGARGKQSTLR